LDGPCTSHPVSDSLMLISAVAAVGSLLIVAAIVIFCICRRNRKTDQEGK
ncbi:hypothetical protein ABG768_001659, partial [Culter alburnus]